MNTTPRLILKGLEIYKNDKWLSHHAVVLTDGSIQDIIHECDVKAYQAHHPPMTTWQFSENSYLVPGFIDLHIHGTQGADIMDEEKRALATISAGLAQEGVTGFLATTMTAPVNRLEAVLNTLSHAQLDHAQLLGIHLEGPFISPHKAGAQNAHHCLPMDVTLLQKWQEECNHFLKIVTCAPELAGSEHFIKALLQANIIPSIGHTDATYQETKAAILAGCKHATHWGNAMRMLHQREPGATGALLLDPTIQCEVIADGIHLHPAMLDLIYRIKGYRHLFLVTDAMRAQCLGNGCYELGGQEVNVNAGKATLKNGTLAGSTLTMPQAIKNIMQFTGCHLHEAIHMASTNPAKALQLEQRKGRIAKGHDADLVVLNNTLDVEMTIIAGNIAYRRTQRASAFNPEDVSVIPE